MPTTLTPESLADLQTMVRELHATSSPWIPSGLGTRMHWGAALQPSPLISLRQCNTVLEHAVDDLTISVQAGLSLTDLQAALAEQNQWLPIDWPWGSHHQAKTAGTVGGLVARGLTGGLRHRHLGVRDQIIGIGLIRSDGLEAHAGGRVVKNVAGYDLMRLLCGSWGSLALISELTLRVQPIRPARALLNLKGALDALEAWRAEVVASTLTLELLNWQQDPKQELGIQAGIASVSDAAVRDQLNRLESLAETHGLKAERHPWDGPLPPPAARPTNPDDEDSQQWLLRISLPPSQAQALFSSQEAQALRDWHWNLAAGAGCGDAWSDQASTRAQVQALRSRVTALGGRLSVLIQPISQPSEETLPAWTDAPSRPLIEAVKRQFDPLQQLSRGRLPGVAKPVPIA
ncbi:FAD-binding oxidoreductase [Synechococcus sp. UW140]|uniref:FAD-binding oxidoreductase n=1 Tax=Synechococcus sp. UW140 TaxID=368503 RepID=UPI002110CFA7|nr:FAD-binding oxidoreductase [Synechococcus sp. UW140]